MATLVIGGAGFIGLNIAQALAARGTRVRLFDLAPPPAGALESFGAAVEVSLGDVRDAGAVERACRAAAADGPFDLVFGAAITADAARDAAEPERVLETNLLSLVPVLRAARTGGVRRIVNLSSVAAYGEAMFGAGPLDEASTPCEPAGLYGLTKFASERVLDRLASLWGLDALSVRLSGAFGPWERATGARDTLSPFFQLMELAQAARPALLAREGLRDWVYAPDVAAAVLSLLDAPRPRERVYNVTGAAPFSVLDWGMRLARLRPGFECRLARAGEAPTVDLHGARDRASLSGARLAAETGFRARYDGAASVAHLDEWVRRQAGAGRSA